MTHSGFAQYSHRDFIKQLRQLLQDRYKWDGDGFTILKELIQNANDAQASTLHLGWSHALFPMVSPPQGTNCSNSSHTTSEPAMKVAGHRAAHPLLSVPAVFAINDGPFLPVDAINITRLGSNSKAGEAASAGRFGLGLKSVFHICEAFFYLSASSAQLFPERKDSRRTSQTLCRVFNPWSPPPGCDERGPYEKWDFEDGTEDAQRVEQILTKRLAPILEGFKQWFCLWIPLRDDRLLNGSPIVQRKFNDKEIFQVLADNRLNPRLAELLPMLNSLNSIQIWTPNPDGQIGRAGSVTLKPGSRRPLRLPEPVDHQMPPARDSYFDGSIAVSTPSADCVYTGAERIASTDQLKSLWQDKSWPPDESIDPETSQWIEHHVRLVPHGALRFMALPPSQGPKKLWLHWCVFLPLGGSHGTEHLEVETTLDRDISVYLHGYFFIDAGRTAVERIDESRHSGAMDEELLRQKWNQAIREDAIWPLFLDAFKAFIDRMSWNDPQIKEFTRAVNELLRKRGTADSSDVITMICRKNQWLFALIPGGDPNAAIGMWSLKSSKSCVYEIPPPKPSTPLFRLLPGLAKTISNRVVTIRNYPRIANSNISDWSPGDLREVFKFVDVNLALSSSDHLAYLADFLEQSVQNDSQRTAVGESLWRQLKCYFQSQAVTIEVLDKHQEHLTRILRHVPVEFRLFLSWAKNDQEGAEEVFRVIADDACELLPLPDSLRSGFHEDCTKIESEVVARIISKVAELQVTRELFATVACDLLDRTGLSRDAFFCMHPHLAVIEVYNCRIRERQRVTWTEYQQRKAQQLLFCDKAGLAQMLQNALGESSVIWRIDPDFAEKILGKNHELSGCGPNEAATALMARRKFRGVDHFEIELGKWPARHQLIDKLLALVKSSRSEEQICARNACRLLIHGRMSDASFDSDLFLAPDDDCDRIAEKLVRHVLQHQNELNDCESSEWRLIKGERAEWLKEHLTTQQQKALRIVPLKFSEDSVAIFLESASRRELDGLSVDDDEYAYLLNKLDNNHNDFLRSLPIHPTVDGNRIAISSNEERPVYWDNGYRLNGDLQQSIVLLRFHSDLQLQGRQRELADVLGPLQVIDLVLNADVPDHYWQSLLKALSEVDDRLPEETLNSLRNTSWIPTRYGARSPIQLICLKSWDGHGLTEECKFYVNVLVEQNEGAFIPDWLLDKKVWNRFSDSSNKQPNRLYDWNVLPDETLSLQNLGTLLVGQALLSIGPIPQEVFRDWLEVDWNLDLMPAHLLLKALAKRFGEDAVYQYATRGVREPIDDMTRLVAILEYLSELHEKAVLNDRKDSILRVFRRYFELLLASNAFELGSMLSSLRLPSQAGLWMSSRELCHPPAANIAPEHVLSTSFSELLKCFGNPNGDSPRENDSTPIVQSPRGAASETTEAASLTIEKYFRAWEEFVPHCAIGGFISVLGGDPDMESLAMRYLGKRSIDETRRNLRITPNCIGHKQLRMSNQRVHASVNFEAYAPAKNVLGEQFNVPLATRLDSLLLGLGNGRHVNIKEMEGSRHIYINLRAFDRLADYASDHLVKLLGEATCVLLSEAFGADQEDFRSYVNKTFCDLKESDQLEIRITQQLILEDAELQLSQLGLQSDNIFGPIISKLTNYRRLRAERDQNEEKFDRKASSTEEEVRSEKIETYANLKRLLEEDPVGQSVILAAIRHRIQGHNQYSCDSIPFELFQNADDACVERRQMINSPIPCNTIAFFVERD